MARYPLFQAPAVFILETFCAQLWGFKPNWVGPFVQQKGAVRSLWWSVQNILKYESTLEQWGRLRTHLIVLGISALNADAYLVYGHGFALSLAYLKQTGRLFPLTENDLMNLCGRSESEILTVLERALSDASLSSEVLALERASELRQQPELATTEQDHQLVHLTKMTSVLNYCAIKHSIRPDQAHDSLNKGHCAIAM